MSNSEDGSQEHYYYNENEFLPSHYRKAANFLAHAKEIVSGFPNLGQRQVYNVGERRRTTLLTNAKVIGEMTEEDERELQLALDKIDTDSGLMTIIGVIATAPYWSILNQLATMLDDEGYTWGALAYDGRERIFEKHEYDDLRWGMNGYFFFQ